MKSKWNSRHPPMAGSLGDKLVPAILRELRGMGSERDRAGMARYGINVENAVGVSIYELRKVAKRLGTDHDLALSLRATGNHEARGTPGPKLPSGRSATRSGSSALPSP